MKTSNSVFNKEAFILNFKLKINPTGDTFFIVSPFNVIYQAFVSLEDELRSRANVFNYSSLDNLKEQTLRQGWSIITIHKHLPSFYKRYINYTYLVESSSVAVVGFFHIDKVLRLLKLIQMKINMELRGKCIIWRFNPNLLKIESQDRITIDFLKIFLKRFS